MEPEIEKERQNAWISIALAWIAGFVDATGFILIFHIFTANMSGNSVALGAYIGEQLWFKAIFRGFPIPMFFIGVLSGTILIEFLSRRRFRSLVAPGCTLEILLILVFIFTYGNIPAHLKQEPVSLLHYYGMAALLAFAMGIQTSVLQRLGSQPVRTTFTTGMLSNCAREFILYCFWLKDRISKKKSEERLLFFHSSFAQVSFNRMVIYGAIWFSYMIGAILSGFSLMHWGLSCLTGPIFLLFLIIIADLINPIKHSIP